MRKHASITLYLCLVLCILLSLVSVSFYSARISAGRVVLASALEQGMYSLFGEYDAELFSRYGLLFLDGGRGSETLQLQKLTRRTELYASWLVNPGKNLPGGRQLLSMQAPAASVTAYVLATDGSGAAFSRQVCTAAKGKLAADGIQMLAGQISQAGSLSETQQSRLPEYTGDTAVSEQEQAEADTILISEDYQDPRGQAAAARGMGILNLVIPEGRIVSDEAVNLSDFPSGRSLQRGIGGIRQTEQSLPDKVLLTAYADSFFTCFTDIDSTTGAGLHYQMEYLICRRGSDPENLKGVLNRLLVMREASNLAFLSADARKRAESLAAATAVGTALGVPYLAPVIAVGIRSAWAYAESLCDLRTLLGGGKVSLVKTAADWNLSVEQLPQFLAGSFTAGKQTGKGFTYEQYLQMMLMVKNGSELTKGMMDLVENSMRHADAQHASFRIDHCIDAMRLELTSAVEGRKIAAEEQYGYGME